jgi:hypothetical protein
MAFNEQHRERYCDDCGGIESSEKPSLRVFDLCNDDFDSGYNFYIFERFLLQVRAAERVFKVQVSEACFCAERWTYEADQSVF